MTNTDTHLQELHIVWAIPSILVGLVEGNDIWNIFAPECEPFWSEVSKFDQFRVVPTACRGVSLACECDNPSVIFVPNRQLAAVLKTASEVTISSPMVLVVEDHPILAPELAPRESSARAGFSVVEPCDPSEVELCASAAAKLSAAAQSPVVLVTHHGLLGGSASVDRSASQYPQAPRKTIESASPIRLGRQLELNRQRTLPSPGEKVSVGFVTIGLSDPAIKYLVSEWQLHGRVPMLNLRLINPIDTVPLERLLSRCRHVVVLEPRPGEVEREIIGVAQKLQREGREVAAIWGRELPPIDPEHAAVKVPVDAIHPSVVARLTQHLLHDVRPSANISETLQPENPALDVPYSRRASFGTSAALQLLRETAHRVLSSQPLIGEFILDGTQHKMHDGIRVFVETWGEDHFVADGINVVRDAANRIETRMLLVWRGHKVGNSLSTMIESIVPSTSDEHKTVVEVSLDSGEDLDETLVAASNRMGVTVIIVSDGEEPRFDVARLAASTAEIDRRGFRPQQAIIIPIEQMAPVKLVPIEAWQPRGGEPAMPLETSITSRWLHTQYRSWRVSLRPMLERVEVTRSKAPVRVVAESSMRLSPPKPIHSLAAKWRVHIAGTRGDQPGVVGKILLLAGKHMGYEVRAQCNSAFVGAGRRAWSQILFTRRQTERSFRPLIGAIPWGEADLLLGWDREEVLRSIDPQCSLQVGSSDRTYAVINTDPLEHQSTLTDINGNPTTLDLNTISSSCMSDKAVLRGFASLARYRFHNERLGDLVQLGMAFQMGFIPVTVDAINIAVSQVEQEGFARSVEAFEFGRRVALDPDPVWLPVKEETQVELERLVKRCVRDLLKKGRRGSAHAVVVRRLIRQSRQTFAGITETEEGRLSMFDLVNGIRRCMLWGGEDIANRFVGLLCSLYASDHTEEGKELTRKVILPLAETMLIRDPIYLARLARSPEVVRRIRSRLNVRLSRGDVLHRRFLSRFRLRLWKWSLQADLRTSDWSSVVVSVLGRVVPKHWRGHKRDWAVRDAVLHAVSQATISSGQNVIWIQRFDALNKLAVSGSLHTATAEEVKKILQS